ncbi:hypothetical protein T440DRAFT_505702 [Plenodomus tracheiphilus IPT5]|uniref:Uncharacterized protein n=1 Tax=Plenodomus tracheiphilus IPT5 TaxID=1408161 RepID=A0A6A7BDC7_9PLEO|nr:hypothetical protein T440DRAFT_505702 [Plenodomus tracheiphilus IPT5]
MESEMRETSEAVAIVGMGCRWPGGVRSAPELWEFLKNRVDGWREFDDPRFSTRGFHHANADRLGTVGMKGAYLLDEDARLFDHSFFNMTALEVETMDPSQRKLLEVTYEAFENAGETWESVSGTRTGVFVGNFCLDHWVIQSRDWDFARPYAFTGAGTSILANRISYVFNLNGPSLTVDTACSSSMYALHLAMNAIRAGDCDAAVVASANWIADPSVQIALDKLGALSASGRSHTFDARAEGYARGEGYGAIYLKRASLAVADGSPMRALVRGSAMNANGRTGGITRPSPAGQEAVIREAYRNAGSLPLADTSYFECHGTGTYVGDPLEVAAVGSVFAGVRAAGDALLVGSTKTNVGHGEGASALASIMKVVLSLEHEAIPPIFDLQTLNPNIDFAGAAVKVVTELTPWPADQVRRASINSFGYGGANAHCIIDHVHTLFPGYVKPGVHDKPQPRALSPKGINVQPSIASTQPSDDGSTDQSLEASSASSPGSASPSLADAPHKGAIELLVNDAAALSRRGQDIAHHPITKALPMTRAAHVTTRRLVLLPFAAHRKESLRLNIQAFRDSIDRFPLSDVAYTLANNRSRLPQRTFCVVDRAQPAEKLHAVGKIVRSPLQPSSVAFIFTGQGAQWPAMGAELLQYRVFQDAISYLDHILSTLPGAPTWTLHAALAGTSKQGAIHSAEISQTVCTALQIGLVDLLASWSVRPTAVAGHSSGEIAAAYASGRITAAEAIAAAYLRGQAVVQNQQEGLMLAVGLSTEQVLPYLSGQEESLRIAAFNSPDSVTISGDALAVKKLAEILDQDGVFQRELKTGGNAYHSHHMIPLGIEYDSLLSAGLACVQKLGLADASERYARIPWYSSVRPSNDPLDIDFCAREYWRENLESPVRFSDAVTNMVSSDQAQVLVEIGPHPALKSPINQILKKANKTSVSYCSTLSRQQDSSESMLELAGALFCMNAALNLVAVNALDRATGLAHGSIAVDLPPYQYAYGPVAYHESRQSQEYRYRKVMRHDLLGSKVVGNAKLRPQWRNILRVKDVPWLRDHRLGPDAIFPGAAYILMVVEAASRIHNETSTPEPIAGHSLRDVSIKASMQIPEDDYGIEVITSMEFVDNPPGQPPSWATFSVSTVTRESNVWTEHCTGRIRVETAGSDKVDTRLTMNNMSRATSARSWYKKFADIGLNYGSTFQPLSDIRTDSMVSNQASAWVSLETTAETMKGESRYVLHPAALDGVIQLGLIACHGGQTDQVSAAFVPVHFSKLSLSASIPRDLSALAAIARGDRRGLRNAHLDLVATTPAGHQVMEIEGLRCTSFSRASRTIDRAYRSPFMRLIWKADVRAMSNSQCRKLFPPPPENVDRAPLWGIVNELAFAIVYNIYENFAGDCASRPEPNPSGEVGHFFDWIKRRGTLDDNEVRREFKQLSSQERLSRINKLVSQAPNVIEVQTSKLLHDNMFDILAERRTGIDVIISENLLTPLYQEGLLMTGVYPQLFRIVESLGHANPNMRYIEIGGGTGGATRIAMQALRWSNGMKNYLDYTFTDISPGFLATAREALSGSGYEDVIYNVLDAEEDPDTSGYEPVYDVVLACQVLHATSNMQRTLRNVGKLLKPGGKLILVETTQNFIVPGVVVGTFTGYWAGIPDGRSDAPFMSQKQWDVNLNEAGFSGTELVLDDFPRPHNTTSVIVSTFIGASTDNIKASSNGDVQLIYSAGAVPPLLDHLLEDINARGFVARPCPFHHASTSVAAGSHAVLFLDDRQLLLDSDERDLEAFQHLARSSTSLIVLTSCGIARGRNPDGAIISGLLRVLQTENPGCRFLSIDIDSTNFNIEGGDSSIRNFTRCLIDRALALRDDSPIIIDGKPTDREFVWQDDALWVSRYIPVAEADMPTPAEYFISDGSIASTETEVLPVNSHEFVRATFETPGVLGSLQFISNKDMWKPLPQDHVTVKIATIGVEYGDLDIWSGRTEAANCLFDYSGTVTAIGTEVNGLIVGDHVFGLSTERLFVGNFVRVPSSQALKLKQYDDVERMMTVGRAYATAIYVFEHIVHMPLDTWTSKAVLVQSAATQLGLAAITLARARGADVFAMVDTPELAAFVVGETSMPPSHILTTGYRHAANTAPRGGFDVILNAARADSEFLYIAPQFLLPLGHLVQSGRLTDQDPHPDEALNMRALLGKNATFSLVDLSTIIDSVPALGQLLLHKIYDYVHQGLIKGFQPFGGATADVSQLPLVLSDFSKSAGSAGKLVLSFHNGNAEVKMSRPTPTARFDGEAQYIITGALGGLGQSIIHWMVDRGARHLVTLSRRPVNSVPEAQQLIDKLTFRGVEIQPLVCDITDKSALSTAMSMASAGRPIKGIVHAAVSWHDLSFDKLSTNRWSDSLAAKVHGTRNLHDLTRSMPLDFFVMTTSLLSVFALATQGAYTAANNFQDAFARYRQAQGLPASTVSFSLIRDLGATGSNASTIDTFERNKTLTLSEKQFLALFEAAFLPQSSPKDVNADPLCAANLTTCLDPAGMLAKTRDESNTGSIPNWYSDGRVAIIMRALSDAQRHASDSSAPDALSRGQSKIVRLQQDLEAGIRAGPAEHSATVSLVERAITDVVAEMLFIDLEAVDPARSVADYGVDSLIAAELRSWFLNALKTKISMLKLLDQSMTISALAATIVSDALASAAPAVN